MINMLYRAKAFPYNLIFVIQHCKNNIMAYRLTSNFYFYNNVFY